MKSKDSIERATSRFQNFVARRGSLLIWLPGMVVLLFGTVLLVSVRRGAADAEAILTMHRTTTTVEQLVSRLKDAETSSRGFYITGDTRYLDDYCAATRDVGLLGDRLRDLEIDSAQVGIISRLLAVAEERVDFLEGNLSAWAGGNLTPADQAARLERGTRIMDEARAVAVAISGGQVASLERRAVQASGRSASTVWLIITGILLVGAFTMLVEMVFRKYGRVQRESFTRIEKQNELLRTQAAELETVRADLEQANARLQRSLEQAAAGEAKLAALIEHSAEVIVITDESGRIRFESPAGVRIFGHAAESRIGRDVFENVHPEDVRTVRRSFVSARRRGAPTNVEFRARRNDGTYAIMSATIVNLLAEPAVQGIVANLLDISELRGSEQKLMHAQKMEAVGRLAGGVAHDFNNLLMVIRGSVEMVLQELNGAGALREDLEEIASAADRGASLTRQLLTISRSAPVEPRLIDVNDIIRDIERLLRRALGEDIDFVTRLEPAIGQVRIEPGHVEQILMNLAVNARDAMPRGGTLITETRSVEVATEMDSIPPGRYLLLAVTDTGSGMTRSVRERVFEPFFTTKEPGYGTGLGLSTVYGIVTRAGGHIWLYSEPELGTTFKIYFPVVDGLDPNRQEHSPGADTQPGTGTIMIVEDEDVVRAIMRRMLTRLGYEVVEAGDAEQALDLADRLDGRVDGIISDVVLPTMSGPELVTRLTERWPHVRVLFASGYTDQTMTRYGVLANGAGFIQKPFNFEELASKVAAMFDAG